MCVFLPNLSLCSWVNVNGDDCVFILLQKSRGKRCAETKKKRRQQYRLNKKRLHRPGKEGWTILAEEALKKRWRELSIK